MLFLCCTEFEGQKATLAPVDILHLAERISHPFANNDVGINIDQVPKSLLPTTLREQVKSSF